jgi:hypothetical protein
MKKTPGAWKFFVEVLARKYVTVFLSDFVAALEILYKKLYLDLDPDSAKSL